MKIAVINETSAADRNADIMAALQGRNHTLYNAGMKKNGEEPLHWGKGKLAKFNYSAQVI